MNPSRYLQLSLVLTVALSLSADRATAAVGDQSPDTQRWYKGNLHTHTLWSDGDEFPDVVTAWYRDRDYHFLVLSDHNVLSEGIRWMKVSEARRRGGEDILDDYRRRFGDDWVEVRGEGDEQEVRLKPLSELRTLYEAPEKFLMIQGEEISDRVHINATHIKDLIPPQGGDTIEQVIQNNLDAVEAQSRRVGQPMIAQLNHPNFQWAMTAEQMAAVPDARFFEVYNGHPAVNNQGDEHRPGTDRLWDIATTLRIGQMQAPPLYGVAVDDSHNYRDKGGARPGRGWIMVRAARLTPEAIIHAMEAGDFYATNGVVLRTVDFDPEAGRLEIAVEPKEGEAYTINFIGTRQGYDPNSRPVEAEGLDPEKVTRQYSDEIGQLLKSVEATQATYEFQGDELYVRAVVHSSQPPENGLPEDDHAQAWTQPVGWKRHVREAAVKVHRHAGHPHPHTHAAE